MDNSTQLLIIGIVIAVCAALFWICLWILGGLDRWVSKEEKQKWKQDVAAHKIKTEEKAKEKKGVKNGR